MGFVGIGPTLSFASHGPSSSEACDFMVYLLQKIFKRIQFWIFVWWKSSFSLPCTFTWKLSVMVRDSNPSTMIRLFWQLDNNSFISNYRCWITCEVKLEAVKFTKHKDLSPFLFFIFVFVILGEYPLGISKKKCQKWMSHPHEQALHFSKCSPSLQRKNFNLSNALQLL